MSNSTTSPLASRFRLWWKARSQRLPRRSTLSTPPSAQVAADLLGHAHAHMLDDLLGAAHVRRDLGDRLEDQVQIADRDALGQQQLQHRLQAGIGDLRGQISSIRRRYSGSSRSSSSAHVLVGQKLRQVVADHLAQVGEQHRHVVDGREALALDVVGEDFRHPHAFMPKAGSRASSPGNVGPRAVAGDDEHIAEAQLLAGDHRAVDLDLIALGRDRRGRR